MFNLFKKKQTSYLGLDLGTSSIKLVELQNESGRPRLVTYGSVEMESNVSREDAAADQQKVAQTLVRLLAKTRARSRHAVAALPNFSVFSSVISLPELSEKKLQEAVQWEAKKFIPMPIENVVLDWKIIESGVKPAQRSGQASAENMATGAQNQPAGAPPTQEKQAGQASGDQEGRKPTGGNLAKCDPIIRILLTAAPRHLVERYVAIFKQANVELLSLETESFALSRSLVGNDSDAILIADVGSLTTDLTVVEKGVPTLSRSIDVGGKTVTKTIGNSMGISLERAEQFKRDVGFGFLQQDPENRQGGVGRLIDQSFAPVINEMRYSIELHQSHGTAPIKKILITGGSAFLPGLTDYLTKQLGIKAYRGNPWARVSHPQELTPALELIAPQMAVAVGLAMREVE